MIEADLWPRDAIPSDQDLTGIQELLQQLKSDAQEHLPSKESLRSRLHSIAQNENTALLVLRDSERSNRIIGMGTLHVWCTLAEGHKGFVDDIVVLDEGYRGFGLGNQITTTLVAVTQNTELAKIRLTSNKNNPERSAAIKLYQKLGFREAGTTLWELDLQNAKQD
ncbi:MAG TPA: GNAT family N-acetyltransferase [Candidatus Paceibacterota bacterium]